MLNWPNDDSKITLPALEKSIISSKGYNVKNAIVTQTVNGIEIALPIENRDEIDSIIELKVKE